MYRMMVFSRLDLQTEAILNLRTARLNSRHNTLEIESNRMGPVISRS